MRPSLLNELSEQASGSFSFVSNSVRLTVDWRKFYNMLILARDWKE